MKKQNLIWLAVGGLAFYLIFFRKRTAAQATSSATEPTPAPPLDKEITSGGFSGMKPPSLWTTEELLNYYKNRICISQGGVLKTAIPMQPSAKKFALDEAVKQELAKRKLVAKCIDYGKYLPPTTLPREASQ